MTLCSEYHVDAHDLERFFLTHIIEEEGDNAFNVTFDSEIPQIPQDVALLRLGCCINWNSDQFNCFLYSSLKSLVIGPGSCSRVHTFWLDNMPKLHTLNIECYAFSDPNSLIDGTFSIANCPNLKKVFIGDCCFRHFKSFSVSNLPGLELFRMNDFSFLHASSFSMRSWLFSSFLSRSSRADFSRDPRGCFPGL